MQEKKIIIVILIVSYVIDIVVSQVFRFFSVIKCSIDQIISFMPSVLYMARSTKISISIHEGIIKKSYVCLDYGSVEDKSLYLSNVQRNEEKKKELWQKKINLHHHKLSCFSYCWLYF